MVSLGALLTNLFSQTTNWLNNEHRLDLSLPALSEQLLSNKGEVTGLSLAQQILISLRAKPQRTKKPFSPLWRQISIWISPAKRRSSDLSGRC